MVDSYKVEVGEDGHLYIDEEKVETGSYVVCRVAPDIIPSERELETLLKQHESFGFGQVGFKGFTTHGFDPETLGEFVTALRAKLLDNMQKINIENKDKS